MRSWGGREQVSKAVSFYLFLYQSGRLGQIHPEMRDEVRKAFWFPLDKAHRKLTYRGEREVLKMAQKIVREHPERLTPPIPQKVSSGPAVERPTAQQRDPSQRGNSPPAQMAPPPVAAGTRSARQDATADAALRAHGSPHRTRPGRQSPAAPAPAASYHEET